MRLNGDLSVLDRQEKFVLLVVDSHSLHSEAVAWLLQLSFSISLFCLHVLVLTAQSIVHASVVFMLTLVWPSPIPSVFHQEPNLIVKHIEN